MTRLTKVIKTDIKSLIRDKAIQTLDALVPLP